jgi:molecular chaperone DnaJ
MTRSPIARSPDPVMNYYSILGVASGASLADIKRAYRRLARLHHPGLNPGDREAAEVYQRISEAYATLVDPERRRNYDAADVRSPNIAAASLEFAGFDFTAAVHGPQAATFSELFADVLHPDPRTDRPRHEPGADLHDAVTLSFAEALKGAERQIVATRQVPCNACDGAGEVMTSGGSCVRCGGTGHVRWVRRHMVFTRACAACAGSGLEKQRRCSSCGGRGLAVRSERLYLRIPAGVRDGARLRIPGQGHAGSLGGRNGDLYIEVRVTPHPLIRREGDDLHMAVPVAITEAALGARIEVPFIDGPVQFRVLPGTQAGRRIRVSGRGAQTAGGGRGDLWIEVRLTLPESLDERSKELLREFAARNAGDVRGALRESFKTEQ